MDVRQYNRDAWNTLVQRRNRWTVPVDAREIQAARGGEVRIVLTPAKHVPAAWLGDLHGAELLCLAGGGGQQGPVLAAAGAVVTVLDNSPAQLAQDQSVAKREQLSIRTIEADMADLSCLDGNYFDMIVHPCSNSFVENVRPVWQEAFRVLKPGGRLLAGFCQPVAFVFDDAALARGELIARNAIPYSDLTDLPAAELAALVDAGEPLCFGHSLEDQLAGQLDAGFRLTGFYEDSWDDDPAYSHLSQYLPAFAATLAVK